MKNLGNQKVLKSGSSVHRNYIGKTNTSKVPVDDYYEEVVNVLDGYGLTDKTGTEHSFIQPCRYTSAHQDKCSKTWKNVLCIGGGGNSIPPMIFPKLTFNIADIY